MCEAVTESEGFEPETGSTPLSAECPIQVTLHGHWINCTFPADHDPWLHSWQTPGASPFVMAPPASDVRNREGGPLGHPYDDDQVSVSREDLRAVLGEAEGFIGGKDNEAFARLAAAVGVQ